MLSLSMALSFSGEGEESFYLIEKALALNPLSSPVYQFALAASFMVQEDYDSAIVALKRGWEIQPSFLPNPVQLCLIYALLDMDDEVNKLRPYIMSMVGAVRRSI